MMRIAKRLAAGQAGNSAVEMALVTPLLLVLIFATFEAGYYFMSEHMVQKAVRDAARYGARLPLVESDGTQNYNCGTTTIGTTTVNRIQKLARTGTPTGTSSNRLAGWTADNMTTVTLTCDASTNSYVAKGVYKDFPNAGAVPVITVSAAVPYPMLFSAFGMGSGSLTLNAKSQAAVFGA
jgi:Flp pilus assembly protein TadG